MASLTLKNWGKKFSLVWALLYIGMSEAMASTTSNLPFASTFKKFQDGLGSFLMPAAVIMLVVTCLMLAFGEWGDGFKKLITIMFWLSLSFGAPAFIVSIFTTGSIC